MIRQATHDRIVAEQREHARSVIETLQHQVNAANDRASAIAETHERLLIESNQRTILAETRYHELCAVLVDPLRPKITFTTTRPKRGG